MEPTSNVFSFNSLIDQDSEFIPLFSKDDEKRFDDEDIPEDLPLLPLRNNVLFPGVVIPITVGRDKSIKLVNDVMQGSKTIGVIAQTDPSNENPETKDLFKVGTAARIIKMLRMPDGSNTVIIQGKKKFRVEEFLQTDPYFTARVSRLSEEEVDREDRVLMRLLKV